jgi:hypothetical protein
VVCGLCTITLTMQPMFLVDETEISSKSNLNNVMIK